MVLINIVNFFQITKIKISNMNIDYTIANYDFKKHIEFRTIKGISYKYQNYCSNKKRLGKRLISSILNYIIIICIFDSIISKINNKIRMNTNDIFINLKIKKSGTIKFLHSNENKECDNIVLPDIVQINGINQSNIIFNYDFEYDENNVTLIWKNPPNRTNCLFYRCSNIDEIDSSNFDTS